MFTSTKLSHYMVCTYICKYIQYIPHIGELDYLPIYHNKTVIIILINVLQLNSHF